MHGPTGNMKLAGIDVSWRAKRALAGGEGGSPQEKCNSRDQKDDGCYMPNRAGESKMENSGNNFLVYAHEVPNKESTYMNFQRCLRSEIVKALRNGKLLRSAAFAFGVVALIGIEPGLLKAQDRQPRVEPSAAGRLLQRRNGALYHTRSRRRPEGARSDYCRRKTSRRGIQLHRDIHLTQVATTGSGLPRSRWHSISPSPCKAPVPPQPPVARAGRTTCLGFSSSAG